MTDSTPSQTRPEAVPGETMEERLTRLEETADRIAGKLERFLQAKERKS